MNGTTISVLNKDLKVIDGYVQLNRPEGVDPNSIGLAKITASSDNLIIMTPIPESEALPFGDVKVLADGIHQYLQDNQGLIEVKTGATALIAGYAYCVIKTLKDEGGVEYQVTMDLDKGDHVLHIEGFFSEIGTTGQREAIILNNAIEQGVINPSTMVGWASDPYDKLFTRGQLMNLSEREEYDVHFAGHPLTELRAFIKFIISNN